MFNPLKMAGDLKNIEKMLKPALEKFMNESGFAKQEEIEEIKARLDKIESMIKDLKNSYEFELTRGKKTESSWLYKMVLSCIS